MTEKINPGASAFDPPQPTATAELADPFKQEHESKVTYSTGGSNAYEHGGPMQTIKSLPGHVVDALKTGHYSEPK